MRCPSLALLLAAPFLHAERLPVKVFTTADGLASDGAIFHIMQCSRGFLWICTNDGVSRFDGQSFRNYSIADGLPGSTIFHAIETRDGNLWFAGHTGVARYDPAAGAPKRFVTYSVGETPASNAVRWLCEESGGRLWIATFAGLFLAKPSADGLHARLVLRAEAPPGTEPDGMAPVFYLLRDRRGVLWASTHYAGIYRILPDGRIEHYTAEHGLPKNVAGPFLEDHLRRIWLGTPHGLLLLEAQPQPNQRIVRELFDTKFGAHENPLLGIAESRDGHLWVGTRTALAEFDGHRFRSYGMENGLSDRDIWSLCVDHQGNIWAGTGSGGLARLERGGFRSYNEMDGIDSSPLFSVSSAQTGQVLAITGLGERFHIHRWDGERFHRIVPQFPPQVTNFGWGLGSILLRDHTGEWWVATREGLCRFPKVRTVDELALTRPTNVYTMRDGLPTNNIYSLFEDSRGDIWIGLMFPPRFGLARWRRDTGTIEDLSHAAGVMPEKTAMSFVEDASKSLWVAFDGALSRYRDGCFRLFTGSDGVPAGAINLYLDPLGQLWGSADSSGIFRVDQQDSDHPRFVAFTTANGLASKTVTTITGDIGGNVYAGSTMGIDRVELRTGRITHFTTADGLASNVVRVSTRDAEGNLWFGTSRGLSKLTLRNESNVLGPPPIRITDVRIDDQSTPLPDVGAATLTVGDLTARQNRVQISFAGVSLGGALRYQYKLEGADKDWSVPTSQQTVLYPGLTAGRYRFLVRALDATETASATPAVLSFNVLPPVWLRWWFLLLSGCAMASFVYALHRYRVGRLLEVERLRTRIATDLHDDIGSSLSRIAILSEVTRQRIGEPGAQLPARLSEIAEFSREAAASMGDIVWAINPHRDSLNDLILRMRTFATDVCSARDIEFRLDAPIGQGNPKLGVDARRQLFLIFKEAVNNAAKRAGAATVSIELRVRDGAVVFEIVDDGTGFDPSLPAAGHGLSNMRMRAEGLGGSLAIHSAPGKGTRLEVRVPLDQ